MQNKKWYLSRTLWFAVGTAIAGIMTALASEFPSQGWMLTIVGIVNFLLRANTNSGIEK
jgi:hypothetical protein